MVCNSVQALATAFGYLPAFPGLNLAAIRFAMIWEVEQAPSAHPVSLPGGQ